MWAKKEAHTASESPTIAQQGDGIRHLEGCGLAAAWLREGVEHSVDVQDADTAWMTSPGRRPG